MCDIWVSGVWGWWCVHVCVVCVRGMWGGRGCVCERPFGPRPRAQDDDGSGVPPPRRLCLGLVSSEEITLKG